jgi:DNA-binding CsgD family transcriptional regulator
VANVLDAPDLERVLAVVEACERPEDLDAYRATALESLAGSVGFSRCTFFLTGPPEPPTAGTDGLQRGFASRVMDQYVEEHSADPFRGALATRILQRDGLASLDQLAGRLTERERRYVDGFLLPNDIRAQLCLWLDTGLDTHGVICVLGDDASAFDARDQEMLLALRPHLGNLLAQHLRRCPEPGLADVLTVREREVVALVAEGCTNGEVARRLGISEETVKKHVSRALDATGARNRTELARRWPG